MIFKVVITANPDTQQMRWLHRTPEGQRPGDIYFDTALGVALVFTGVAWIRLVPNADQTVWSVVKP